MIILNNPKLIFLKPRKVAGSSFEIALSNFATINSIITPLCYPDELLRQTLGYYTSQNFKFCFDELIRHIDRQLILEVFNKISPKRCGTKLWLWKYRMKFWEHMTALELKNNINQKFWEDAYKISIVRNPYDTVISRYFYKRRASKLPYSIVDFENFCILNKSKINQNKEQYFIDGKEIIDFFIRYESFKSDILVLENKFPNLKGLYNVFSSINAKTGYRPRDLIAKEFYTKSPIAKEIVTECYKFEIDKFGYKLL